MRRQEQHRPEHRAAALTWAPALVALGIMLTGFLGTLVVLELDAFRPRVGDMVVFRPKPQDSDAWQIKVAASNPSGRAGDAGCVLDPTVMAASGGSLVVEARQETSPAVYRVHWAGGRTDTSAQDCGGSADLTLTRIDLQKLANAAGGFGIGAGDPAR